MDKDNLKGQLEKMEKFFKNMSKPMNMGNNFSNNSFMTDPMIQQELQIMRQSIMETQRILQDIYITVHETHRAVSEIKYKLDN